MAQSKGRVLVIDDDPQLLKLYHKKLSAEGFEISLATNGKEGIDLYRRELPDLVVTDLVMPEKEGLEMIQELKQEFPDVKIIAVSGGGRNDPTAYLKVAGYIGAQRTFTKPIDWQELIQEMSCLINRIPRP